MCVLPDVLPVAPPGGEKKYKLPLFTLFRPLCPAFSFADVDTYAICGTVDLAPDVENQLQRTQ